MANELEQLVLSKAQKWLDGDYDEATKKQGLIYLFFSNINNC